MALRCPTCKHDVLPPEKNPSFPFCSVRCRELDLVRWLNEDYRVAGAPADVEEDETPTAVAPADDDGDA